ncbi:MAG: asparagine--tRNA ligase [Desulfovibrionaceae bacterium]|nr:asparagine--tRNA ligase [Desulfovibrionaceae bacterium]
MKRTLIAQALEASEACDSITICGWIRSRRDAKGFSFLAVNDGSTRTHMQCIVDNGTLAARELPFATNGAAVAVTGTLTASPGKEQQWEIHAQSLKVLGLADPETYPLQKKRQSDEFLRSIAHLRPRTNKYASMLRISSEAAFAIHSFFRAEHFTYVRTPILTGSDCEGAGELFRVTTLDPGNKDTSEDFFTKPCRLTVSGQLEGETLASALGRIYTFGPTFRAEDSRTPRHAAEFWMIEPEMAFADLSDIMELAESMLKSVIASVLDSSANDLALFDRFIEEGLIAKLESWTREPFAVLTYTESVRLLEQSGESFVYPVHFGVDLQTEHERYLAETYCQKPVIIIDYPKSIKPFYMRENDDGATVAAMDVLLPGIGEIIGGSQREERLEKLEARLAKQTQTPEDYWWYTDLRRFGSVPHAGFGLGFERLLMLLTGIRNIRDVIPFPRTPGSLEF